MYKENQNKLINIVDDGDIIHIFITAPSKKKEKVEDALQSTFRELSKIYNFFNDITHLKKCVGLMKDWKGELRNLFKDEWVKWRLNTYFKDTFSIAKVLTKAGYAVELYYEEIKE